MWYGRSLFAQVLVPGDVSSDDMRKWRPGPLYNGTASITLARWHFWRDGFRAAAAGESEKATGLDRECQMVANKAAAMMDSLEVCMTFHGVA